MKPRTAEEMAAYYREQHPEEAAQNAYAEAMIRKDQAQGWIEAPRYQDEKAPDGRSLLKDNQGYYRATRDELGGWKHE